MLGPSEKWKKLKQLFLEKKVSLDNSKDHVYGDIFAK